MRVKFVRTKGKCWWGDTNVQSLLSCHTHVSDGSRCAHVLPNTLPQTLATKPGIHSLCPTYQLVEDELPPD